MLRYILHSTVIPCLNHTIVDGLICVQKHKAKIVFICNHVATHRGVTSYVKNQQNLLLQA